MSSTKIQSLAHSLQDTARVLSARGENELASMQEMTNLLLGELLLDGIDMEVFAEQVGPQATAQVMGISPPALRALVERIDSAAWTGSESGHLALLRAVRDDDEWLSLPVLLQNYIERADLPCLVVIPVWQLVLEGDSRHRHVAMPALAVLTSPLVGALRSRIAVTSAELRAQAELGAQEGAKLLDPALRILVAGLATLATEVKA